MALGDFFRINLPYGLQRSQDGKQWAVHNREYSPLGTNNSGGYNGVDSGDSPLYVTYKNLTENTLLAAAWHPVDGVKRNAEGEIIHVFLYNDATNPANQKTDKLGLWADYFRRIRLLSSLLTDDIYRSL